MLRGCHLPAPSVHACNLVGTLASGPAWVCILCAWRALIGVTGREEFSSAHTATCPCAQPAVSRTSSAGALLVITVGIIFTYHLCAQGCGVPSKNHTPIYPEALLASSLTHSFLLQKRLTHPSLAQSNVLPQRARPGSPGAPLWVPRPPTSWGLPGSVHNSLQHPALCG